MSDHGTPYQAAANVVVLQGGTPPGPSRLPRFIAENVELIVGEWEAFARTLMPISATMTPHALRDHIYQILAFIVPDMETSQTAEQQKGKSHGSQDETNTAAETHAALRLAGGFDIGQMVSEYRALRASVLKLWSRTSPPFDAQDIEDVTRFNEAIDQELAESVNFYTRKVTQSRDLIAGILGHDLRGPLQAITLSAELALHMGKLSERQTMLIGKMLESGHRMEDLISNLLDVTRARFGSGLPIVRKMMNMGFIARQIVDEVQVVNPSRTLELTLSGNLMGEWDKARIGQVFSNLLGNAIQYGFQGSPIRVDLKGHPDAVILSVTNDGITIPAEKKGIIFDPLTRGLPDSNTMPPAGNLGLGLYITKEVVIAHGGTIEVTSSDLLGTMFTAVFPRPTPGPAIQEVRRHA